ncbi:PREDICTED: peptidyl-prolyl cis-trans isomerase CWC27 homolog [Dinoponera quadriceps]|uniref:Spliceosome-associated protein CWC27 homolog n=1 Tax=Dinoponera quadriceps TaxID=609295 RepID=A0A6P3XK83_DINQU|nr:PREDICTED: peptidyl-prolyl cis-trans isomerase CWC27 homolog [Dinoponera quadriceps]
MSNIYIQEPPTTGKVVMKTTFGDIDLELWTKEAPKACKNFIQLCMEGYYNGTIFHRVVKGFIAQGGDPTGTGEGGESIYGYPFKDEFHTRLRFCRRGLLAMANAGKDDNGSQFFFTLGSTPDLQNNHTIFGKVTGETIYNMLKLEDALVDENDRPQYPQKILKTEVLSNPFQDIVPRVGLEKKTDSKDSKKVKKAGVKNFKLLSFGEEAEEDEEESSVLNKQYSGKGKSAHDCLSDPKLSAQPVVEPAGPPSKRFKEDRSSDWESDGETRTPEELAALAKEKEAMKERIKSKLRDSKKTLQSKPKVKDEVEKEETNNEDKEVEEEYYFGKDRYEERKKKAEAIRKEIRELKRDVQNEKRAKKAEREQADKEENDKEHDEKEKSEVMKEYTETQMRYKKAKAQLPKKGKVRENFTMELLNKFRDKLQNAKEHTKNSSTEHLDKTTLPSNEDDDPTDESWMTHTLHCEEKAPVLAKDASTKDDDWFEIYDPRNPLNKRRRGEKSKDDRSGKNQSRHK